MIASGPISPSSPSPVHGGGPGWGPTAALNPIHSALANATHRHCLDKKGQS